jgi:hypothetical protein
MHDGTAELHESNGGVEVSSQNPMKPVLLVRAELASKYELRIAEKYFPIEESRMNCGDSLVVGRYSVLPFYDELDRDLRIAGSRLVNSVDEHRWITSFDYYRQLKDYTPETWTEDGFPHCAYPGPFVVKGRMSSKKRQWKTHMFASTKHEAWNVAQRLKEDSEILEQGVVFRRYVPLKTYETGHQGLPFTNEWRFFYLRQWRLSYGYYWSMADCVAQAELKPAALELAEEVARVACKFTTFFAMDLAETENGDWTLIELNDGQTAAPSENDLDELYGNLRRALSAEGLATA